MAIIYKNKGGFTEHFLSYIFKLICTFILKSNNFNYNRWYLIIIKHLLSFLFVWRHNQYLKQTWSLSIRLRPITCSVTTEGTPAHSVSLLTELKNNDYNSLIFSSNDVYKLICFLIMIHEHFLISDMFSLLAGNLEIDCYHAHLPWWEERMRNCRSLQLFKF